MRSSLYFTTVQRLTSPFKPKAEPGTTVILHPSSFILPLSLLTSKHFSVKPFPHAWIFLGMVPMSKGTKGGTISPCHSLGLVLYEALTGQPAQPGGSATT
jgi:hypothetical protein